MAQTHNPWGDHSPKDNSEINQLVIILSWPQLLPILSSALCWAMCPCWLISASWLPLQGFYTLFPLPETLFPQVMSVLVSCSCFLFLFHSLTKTFLSAVYSNNLFLWLKADLLLCHLLIFFPLRFITTEIILYMYSLFFLPPSSRIQVSLGLESVY